MCPEVAIATLIKQIATAASLIVLPDRRDQKEPTNKSIVTYQLISNDANNGVGGPAHQDKARVQLDVTGPRKTQVLLACQAIREHIDGFRGTLNDADFGTMFVCGVEYAGERSTYSPATNGSEAGDYSHAVDYMIDMSEPFTR